jgi:23S rRNA (pseudouridine1915-N3)-methyltransferase
MRVIVVAVGRARSDPAQTLFDDYTARLPWQVELREVREDGRLAAEQRKAAEGAQLLKAVPRGAVVVALDRRGRALSSEAFAAEIGRWRDGGAKVLAFLIGGPEGLDPAVSARADLVLSLGAMTWPHMMTRAMLAEQLYRAASILAGHPYHRA